MRFYNHKSSAIFDIYLKLYESELSFEKKKLIFKSLLVGESWSWKITGISKLCLESFKKNKFEKSRKFVVNIFVNFIYHFFYFYI